MTMVSAVPVEAVARMVGKHDTRRWRSPRRPGAGADRCLGGRASCPSTKPPPGAVTV